MLGLNCRNRPPFRTAGAGLVLEILAPEGFDEVALALHNEEFMTKLGVEKKRVLNVGHCQADHRAIRAMLESNFDVQVDSAAAVAEALDLMSQYPYQAVLVNRVFDSTAEEGMTLIQRAQESPFLKSIPILLVSNFESARKEAQAAGAAGGFGKARLHEPDTVDILAHYLR